MDKSKIDRKNISFCVISNHKSKVKNYSRKNRICICTTDIIDGVKNEKIETIDLKYSINFRATGVPVNPSYLPKFFADFNDVEELPDYFNDIGNYKIEVHSFYRDKKLTPFISKLFVDKEKYLKAKTVFKRKQKLNEIKNRKSK